MDSDLPVNLGYGAALQTGYKYALREGYDVYTMTDAIADTHRRRASQFEEGI